MVFEIDSEHLEKQVELTKMEFIQNKIFAYTEEQRTEGGKNVKVSIMTTCGETYDDETFAPESLIMLQSFHIYKELISFQQNKFVHISMI